MNNFAITSGGLGDIIERGGAAMATANTSLEKTLALGTAGNEILNNPERVGNGLKTLALRLRGSAIELEAAGEEVDEYVTSTSLMQEKIKALTKVDIMRSATEYKDVYEILDEIAQVYDDLEDIDRAALTEALFGKNQANLGTAILTNFETAREVLKDLDSGAATGSATKEYDKWLESLEAKIAKLGSKFERLSIAIFDDDMLGNAIDGLSTILSILSSIAEVGSNFSSFAGIAGIAGGIFSAMMPDFAPVSWNRDEGKLQSVVTLFPRMRKEMQTTLDQDLSLMHKYLELTSTGDQLTKDQNDLKSKMSDSARIAVLGNFDLSRLDAYKEKQQEIIDKTKLSVKVSELFKDTLLSIGAGLASMGISWLAGFALDKIVQGIGNAIYKTENLLKKSEELKETWKSSREELNDNKKVLDQYGDRFAVLSQGVSPTGENVSLGTEEYAEYLSIRNQIASTFPKLIRWYDAEGNALLNLSGNVQNITNALKEAYDEQVRQQRIQEQTDFLSTVGKASYTEMYGYGSTWNPWREFSGGKDKHIQNAQALINLLSDEENAYKNLQQLVNLNADRANGVVSDFVSMWDDMGPTFAELMKGIGYNDAFNELGGVKLARNFAEDAPEVISKLAAEYIKTLTQSLNMSDWQAEGRRVLEDAFDPKGEASLSKLSEETKNVLLPIFDYINDPEWYSQFDGNANKFHAYLAEHLLQPLQNKDIQQATEGLFGAEKDWLSGKLTRQDYEDRLKSYYEGMAQMGEFAEALYSSILSDDFEARIEHAAKALGITAEQAKQQLTLPQIDWIDRNIESGESTTYDEVIAGIAIEAERAAVEINALTEAYTKFSEARATAMTAMSSLSEKGYLTPEEVQQIADAGLSGAVKTTQYGSSYVDYQAMRNLDKANTQAEIEKRMEAIRVKTEEASEAYAALFEAQQEGNLDELKNQRAIIDARKEEIEIINRQIDALEGSLSALNAFKQASSMGELGDNFRATKDAIDAIKDGLESGRVGTNKFAAAVELMFGEDILSGFKSGKIKRSDLSKMMESVGGFYDEDGNINRDAAFKRFADKNIGTFFAGQDGERRFKLNQGTTMADIQRALGGVSLEMATYFLDAINEFAQGDHELLGPAEYLASYDPERAKALQEVKNMAVQAASVIINADEVKTNNDEVPAPPKEEHSPEAESATIAETEAIVQALQQGENLRFAELKAALAEAKTSAKAEADKAARKQEIANQAFVLGGDLSFEEHIALQRGAWTKAYVESIEASMGSIQDKFKEIFSPSEIAQALAELNEAELQASMEFKADTSTVEEANSELVEEVEEGATMPVDTDTTAGEQGIADLKANAESNPIIMSVDVRNPYATPRSNPTVSHAAQVDGGIAYADGSTLVGELAPEIVVDRKTGTWSLVEYPQLRKLNAGDIVFNGQQTKAILNGQKTGFSKTVGGKAKADGNVSKTYKWKDGTSTTVQMPSYIAAMIEAGVAHVGSRNKWNSQPAGGGTGGKGSGGGSSGKQEEEEKEWYDWIVRLLEKAKKATEKAIEDVAEKVGYIAKNVQTDVAIQNTQSELEKNQAAADRYMQQADLIARQSGFNSNLISDIQNGKIDITQFDKETLDVIKKYEEWYNKAVECKDAIEELKKQELELQRQKLDNIDKYFDHKLDRLEARLNKANGQLDQKAAYGQEIVAGDYAEAIATTQEKIAELQNERKIYQDQFDELVQAGVLEPDSDAWHEYIAALEEMDEAIVGSQIDLSELINAMENIPLTNLQYALERLNALQNQLEAFQSFHNAQGAENTVSTYEDLIRNGFEQIANLREQNAALLEQQNGLDINSEKWQELQQQIEGNEATIWDLMAAQESWNDSIIDLEISKLQERREELEKTNEELRRKKEMEDALEELEKARTQRNKLVFRENVGFVYEADQDAIKEAQNRVDELRHQEMLDKIDDAIEALEDMKPENNVYDYTGTQVLNDYNSVIAGELYELLQSTADISDLFNNAVAQSTQQNTANHAAKQALSIQIGDLYLNGVQSVDDLANAIIQQLPNTLLQKLYQ